MSAEVLREAAALMRSRANAVVPDGNGEEWFHPSRIKACLLAWPGRDDEFYGAFHAARDAAHMAAWSPSVALFAAEWLDQAADWREANPGEVEDEPDLSETNDPALVFARAYLGGDR